MKECKYSKMLPCYRDGYGVWHHSDDTHDKVYELNKQMCDIGKTMNDPMKPLSEEAIQEIAKALEITRNPKDIMEEKKTKKMTKAEAFEYLKGKKVKCYKVGEHYGEELLKKLTECGCTSNIFLPKGILSVWAIFISDVCDLSILDTAHADQYGNYDLCEISADDILSIEIVDEKKCSEEDGLDLISTVGARLSEVLRRMEGHKHIVITEDDVILYDEGMSLFHSDPF